MSEVAIRVENLGKRYRLGEGRVAYRTLRDAVAELAAAPMRRLRAAVSRSPTRRDDSFWALRDVTFDVARGEVVGIVGPNGAGKSTLLKILSQITRPTEGYAEILGRVGSLLEVGTGFHPELTGRENVYLNGAVLGMSRAEIARKFDEVVAFAEIERFIDTPVKRYSSGMYLRLAFSVAAHLEPEILLVDEVLAVGDAAFQKKCLGKMGEVAGEGRTVLFVSHNLGLVRALCPRTLLIEGGRATMDGGTEAVLQHYLAARIDRASEGAVAWSASDAPGDDVVLRRLSLVGSGGAVQSTFDLDHPVQVEIEYEVRQPVRGFRFVLQLKTSDGVVAFASTDHIRRGDVTLTPGLYRSTCIVPERFLNTGRYFVYLHAGIPGLRQIIPGREYLSFSTEGGGSHGSHYREKWMGVVAPELEWTVDQPIAAGERR